MFAHRGVDWLVHWYSVFCQQYHAQHIYKGKTARTDLQTFPSWIGVCKPQHGT